MNETGTRFLDLDVTARAANLRRIREEIAGAAQETGLNKQGIQDLVHAVDEACQNIIRYGYADEPDGPISLSLIREGAWVKVIILDSAPAIDVGQIVPRQIDAPERGGFGAHIIRACVDDIALDPGPNGHGNRLTLSKRLG